jgi:hypothetical protein
MFGLTPARSDSAWETTIFFADRARHHFRDQRGVGSFLFDRAEHPHPAMTTSQAHQSRTHRHYELLREQMAEPAGGERLRPRDELLELSPSLRT